jgi:hypothetical protein
VLKKILVSALVAVIAPAVRQILAEVTSEAEERLDALVQRTLDDGTDLFVPGGVNETSDEA